MMNSTPKNYLEFNQFQPFRIHWHAEQLQIVGVMEGAIANKIGDGPLCIATVILPTITMNLIWIQ